MKIGYLRNRKSPSKLSRLLAMSCKSRGIDVIYMTPWGVNKETGTVDGKAFINNEWVSIRTSLPPFIDISPYCFKKMDKRVIDYLKEKTILSYNRENLINSEKLHLKIKADTELNAFALPSSRMQKFEDILKETHKYKCVILRPVNYSGKRVYIINKNDDLYNLTYGEEKKYLSIESLKEFYDAKLKGNNYIVQKSLESRTITGECFSCRIHVEKDIKGKWNVARNYVMVRIGDQESFKISKNKGIADINQFLRANFGEQWKEINKDLNFLAHTLPYKYEKWRKTRLLTLGIDVGIDDKGKCYVLHVNTAPNPTPLLAQVAILRMQYYEYILQNKKM